MTTLITDGFSDDPKHAYAFDTEREYVIVYGRNGYTDALSAEALNLLLEAGAIELERTQTLPNLTVYLYRSVEGRTP